MADDRVVSEIVNTFFLITCQHRDQLNADSLIALCACASLASIRRPCDDDVTADSDEAAFIAVRTPFPQMGKHRLSLCCNGFEQFLCHACQCVNELCASQSDVVALCSLWFAHLLRTCRWPVDT